MVDLSKIEKVSPLYSYWQSDQNDFDEKKRLLISNKDSPTLYLFEKEPYKWEILFQSIIREIIKGDDSSIKGLKVLLSNLSIEVKSKVVNDLIDNQFINKYCYEEINNQTNIKLKTKKNFLRFLRILLAIFTNPYGIEIKRKKTHIYEKTGFILNHIKKLSKK